MITDINKDKGHNEMIPACFETQNGDKIENVKDRGGQVYGVFYSISLNLS